VVSAIPWAVFVVPRQELLGLGLGGGHGGGTIALRVLVPGDTAVQEPASGADASDQDHQDHGPGDPPAGPDPARPLRQRARRQRPPQAAALPGRPAGVVLAGLAAVVFRPLIHRGRHGFRPDRHHVLGGLAVVGFGGAGFGGAGFGDVHVAHLVAGPHWTNFTFDTSHFDPDLIIVTSIR
jgi:hypothetical protein